MNAEQNCGTTDFTDFPDLDYRIVACALARTGFLAPRADPSDGPVAAGQITRRGRIGLAFPLRNL
jgi:hypothetical protein